MAPRSAEAGINAAPAPQARCRPVARLHPCPPCGAGAGGGTPPRTAIRRQAAAGLSAGGVPPLLPMRHQRKSVALRGPGGGFRSRRSPRRCVPATLAGTNSLHPPPGPKARRKNIRWFFWRDPAPQGRAGKVRLCWSARHAHGGCPSSLGEPLRAGLTTAPLSFAGGKSHAHGGCPNRIGAAGNIG
jgi:hypothetical protein